MTDWLRRTTRIIITHWRGGPDAAPLWLRLSALSRAARADFAFACASRALAGAKRGPRLPLAQVVLARRGAVPKADLDILAAEILSVDDPAYDRAYHEALTLVVYAARATREGRVRYARWCARRAIAAAADPEAERRAQDADLSRLAQRP